MKKALLLFLLITSTSFILRSQTDTIPVEKEGDVYIQVDEEPEFPGGQEALFNYIRTNIRYPEMAKESGIMGKVYISFTVETDGHISNVKVIRGIGGGCDEEAVRVIKNMPAWKPGKMNGKPVKAMFKLPIQFKII